MRRRLIILVMAFSTGLLIYTQFKSNSSQGDGGSIPADRTVSDAKRRSETTQSPQALGQRSQLVKNAQAQITADRFFDGAMQSLDGKDYLSAADKLRQAVGLDPSYREALAELGLLEKLQLGLPEAGARKIEQALALDPQDEVLLDEWTDYYLTYEDPQACLTAYDRLLALHPNSALLLSRARQVAAQYFGSAAAAEYSPSL